jgi:hypothetical protein
MVVHFVVGAIAAVVVYVVARSRPYYETLAGTTISVAGAIVGAAVAIPVRRRFPMRG